MIREIATVRSVETCEGRLSYTDEGRGHLLAFIHGWPFNKAVYAPLVERLQHGYRCVAFDLLGVADSRTPDVRHSVAAQALLFWRPCARWAVDRSAWSVMTAGVWWRG